MQYDSSYFYRVACTERAEIRVNARQPEAFRLRRVVRVQRPGDPYLSLHTPYRGGIAAYAEHVVRAIRTSARQLRRGVDGWRVYRSDLMVTNHVSDEVNVVWTSLLTRASQCTMRLS